MKKNINISDESIKAMKEFRQKQINTNIKLHKIFLLLILFINIGLTVFIIIYKRKISEIKSRSSNNSDSINSDRDVINKRNTEIEHKIVNVMAYSYNGLFHFSFILETKSEVDMVKKSLFDFYQEKNIKINTDNINMKFKYQGSIDGDSFSVFKQRINYNTQAFIFFVTDNNNRFGFYFEDYILIDKKNKYASNNNNCFLISFQKDGLFKCIGKNNKLEIKKDDNGMMVIGDGDIIVKNNYIQGDKKMGIINFPFKSFDVSTINTNIFTGEEDGEFNILGIEIFNIDFNE
jgi:hypothetical protein